MNSTNNTGRKRRRSAPPPDAPLIWAHDGDGDVTKFPEMHPAYLLQESPQAENSKVSPFKSACSSPTISGDEANQRYAWVQWASTGEIARIAKSNISLELPSRRGRSERVNYNEMPDADESSGNQNDYDNNRDECSQSKSVRRKRLSLSKQQRLNWRQYLEKQQVSQMVTTKQKDTPQPKSEIDVTNNSQISSAKSQSNEPLKIEHMKPEEHEQSLPDEKNDASASSCGSEEANALRNRQNPPLLNSINTNENEASEPPQPCVRGVSNKFTRDVTNPNSSKSWGSKEIIEIDDDTCNEDNEIISISDESVAKNSQQFVSVGKKSLTVFPIDVSFGGVRREPMTTERAQPFDTSKIQMNKSTTQQKPNPLITEEIETLKMKMNLSNGSQPYSFRSSAYVQHIAEACSLIMNDVRWRTCSASHVHETNSFQSLCFTEECKFIPLFSSEKGDDLSAIKAFMSLYDVDKNKYVASDDATSDVEDDTVKNGMEQQGKLSRKYEMNGIDPTEDNRENDEIFERAIHLYSRMFHRKGPWFDVADLYARYYAPKSKTVEDDNGNDPNQQMSTGDFVDNSKSPGKTVDKQQSTSDKLNEAVNEVLGNSLKDRANFFFTPKSYRSKNDHNISSESKSTIASNQNEDVSRHRVALECLFVDIMRLLSLGLVRLFDSEFECGYVVGSVVTSNNGTNVRGNMLSAEERRELLRRLGGKNSSGKKSNTERTNETPKNEILAQMQRQKSVFSVCSKIDLKATNMLPVRKHVDYILLQKLAAKVSAMMRSRDGTPQKPRKSDLAGALQIVNDAWRNACSFFEIIYSSEIQPHKSRITTSIRLREAPLRTLRRCLRLFLCSTGGPGSMRGDGTNGWRSVSDQIIVPTDSLRSVDPISRDNQSSGNWHNVQYPGLSKRLGLSHFELGHCFTALSVSSDYMDSPAIVFHCHSEFKLWEIGAEIRSNFDCSMEAYETERISHRRRQRELKKKQSDMSEDSTGFLVDRRGMDFTASKCSFNDGQALLRVDRRRELVEEVLASDSPTVSASLLCEQIEYDILSLIIPSDQATKDQFDKHEFDREVDDGYISDNERALMTAAIVCNSLLRHRITHASVSLSLLCTRPWLRHMSFDACLCYIIWDTIPIFERNGHHSMAVKLLRTILFGSPRRIIESCSAEAELFQDIIDTNPSIYCILPRRNRGKAYERFVIDLSHAERSRTEMDPQNTKKSSSGNITSKNTNELSYTQQLCNVLIQKSGRNGSVPFSSLRNIARKLRAPLEETMSGIENDEMNTLNIRVCGGASECTNRKKNNRTSGYVDWRPKTDFAIANSLSNEDGNSAVGRRCAFVGWESNDSIIDAGEGRRSLNVEELAIEEYFSGRLPQEGEIEHLKGHWVGWHDEGGHVRALFRIMCLRDILASTDDTPSFLHEQKTVFLSPYQSSPHDLHVGCFHIANAESGEGMDDQKIIRGFYERRRQKVAAFLSKISQLDSQGIVDFLYESVEHRWRKHKDPRSAARDPTLQKDLSDLRTLSMIAVGIGGKGLASIFRSLFYDYRHYSGGLPDCLLARATYCNSDTVGNNLASGVVDLGDWIGESFSKESIEERSVSSHVRMLYDRDDEFLGCSKNMDGSNASQRARGAPRIENTKKHHTTLPSKLELQHTGQEVMVEIMFVEVKSANDRLDARQEDWLNILDGVCNARVCKFENSKIPKKNKKS
ncbi:hypothetical protein ACHAXS_011836 [Conticribra weissflogii]